MNQVFLNKLRDMEVEEERLRQELNQMTKTAEPVA
jgi:hypothetical protein